MPLLKGPSVPRIANKPVREATRYTNITSEMCEPNPAPLAKRFTKFKTGYNKERVEIPRNLIGGPTVVPGGTKTLDVGQIPED